MSTADGSQFRKVKFQVANVNKAIGSVSNMIRNGNRVVFDAPWSYMENKTKKHTVAWRRRRRKRCGHDGGASRTRPEEQTALWEAGHVAWPVSPNDSNEGHGMWDRGGLPPMEDEEKMNEDKREQNNEEDEAEEEEEEHQKWRAMASLTYRADVTWRTTS